MLVRVYNRQKDLKIGKSSARALVLATLSHLKISAQEVSLYFVSEKIISDLHGQFFQDPTPTDCISFPIDENHLGEIFVSPRVAIDYGTQRGIDPYEETSLYVVHGLLHLIGYDDLEPKLKRTMRKKEKSCMAHLYETRSLLRPK